MQNKYKDEVINRWGNTSEYNEFSQKEINGENLTELIMTIFKEFGELKHLKPNCDIVQEQVRLWHEFINNNLYSCSKTVLKSLAQMYVADERFKNNIDSYGGVGTAIFVKEAVDYYCL